MAFEPSFVPVNRSEESPDPNRPDMRAHANWLSFGPSDVQDGDHSRYVVDGGVLANTPTREALSAIQRLPSSRQVQRVMLLVYPHASSTWKTRPDQPDAPPTAVDTLTHLLQTLTGEGSRTFVNEVEEHNRRAATRQNVRTDIIAERGADLDWLHDRAECVADLYKVVRRRRTARDFAARVQIPATMSFDQVREAAYQAQVQWMSDHQHLPFLPADLATGRPKLNGTSWAWGTTPALDVADMALHIVDAVQRRAPADAQISSCRSEIHAAYTELRRIEVRLNGVIDDRLGPADQQPDVAYWLRRLDLYAWLMNGEQDARVRLFSSLAQSPTGDSSPRTTSVHLEELSGVGHETAQAVSRIARALNGVPLATDSSTSSNSHAADEAWTSLLEAHRSRRPRSANTLVSVLMDLHIVSWTIGDDSTENVTPVDLVQISAQTQNAFARYSLDLHSKLGGASVARFSGFLKRSWRLNDWTWGRLDAATMLTRILLSPERLQALSARLESPSDSTQDRAKAVVSHLVKTAYDVPVAVSFDAWVAARPWAVDLVPDAREQVARALAGDIQPRPAGGQLPPYELHKLTELLTYARHTDVIIEELPLVASAIVADRFDGANPRSHGERFLQQYGVLLKEVQQENATPSGGDRRLDLGARALTAFDLAGIGREPMDQERSSDQMIRTGVTAASVGATWLDSPSAGLGRINPVTRALRGAMRLPYWVALGLTSAGATARFLALVALGGGGVLLALSLLGVLQGSFASTAAAIGAGAVLFAFAYAAMRTGTLLHGMVLLSAAVPLAVVGVQNRDSADGHGLGTAIAAVAIVLALVILGSLPTPLRSPAMTGGDAVGNAHRRLSIAFQRVTATWGTEAGTQHLIRIARNVGVILLGLGAVAWVSWTVARDTTLHTIERELWWCVVVSAVLGLLYAWVGGALLGTWRWRPGTDKPPTGLAKVANCALGVWPSDANLVGDTGRWVGMPVSLPTGVTVGWSWVYGAIYALVAGALRWARDRDDKWLGSLPGHHLDSWIVGTQLASILLFLAVPALLPLQARKRITKIVVDQARAGTYRHPPTDHLGNDLPPDNAPYLEKWLPAHDMAYRYLVSPKGDQLQLRAAGRTLEERLRLEQPRQNAAPAGAAAPPADAGV